MTFHGTMHLIFGGASFGGLTAACFAFVRTFISLGQKPWAIFSAMIGLLFLAAFFSAANASQRATSIQFFLKACNKTSPYTILQGVILKTAAVWDDGAGS